jgi:branched-chain amino acid transport system permease protein
VVGYAGLLDLGYVAFYAVGAYSYALLASPAHNIHLPFVVILVIGVSLAMICGALLGFPTLRLRGDYLAIVTLGFGEIIRILLVNLDTLTEGPAGVTNIDRPSLLVVQLASARDYYYLILGLCVLAVLFAQRLQDSRIGRAWAAIREDEDAARATGVKIVRLKLMAYVMGACTAGFAGVVFAGLQGFVSPESFVLTESVLILSMIILGGMGHIPGVIVGAILLVVLPEAMRQFQQDRLEIFGLGLVVMMLIRPEGIWPSRIRRLELHEPPAGSADAGGEPAREPAG